MDERANLFIEAADADRDELLGELDKLEVDILEDELDKIPDPDAAPISAAHKASVEVVDESKQQERLIASMAVPN